MIRPKVPSLVRRSKLLVSPLDAAAIDSAAQSGADAVVLDLGYAASSAQQPRRTPRSAPRRAASRGLRCGPPAMGRHGDGPRRRGGMCTAGGGRSPRPGQPLGGGRPARRPADSGRAVAGFAPGSLRPGAGAGMRPGRPGCRAPGPGQPARRDAQPRRRGSPGRLGRRSLRRRGPHPLRPRPDRGVGARLRCPGPRRAPGLRRRLPPGARPPRPNAGASRRTLHRPPPTCRR